MLYFSFINYVNLTLGWLYYTIVAKTKKYTETHILYLQCSQAVKCPRVDCGNVITMQHEHFQLP